MRISFNQLALIFCILLSSSPFNCSGEYKLFLYPGNTDTVPEASDTKNILLNTQDIVGIVSNELGLDSPWDSPPSTDIVLQFSSNIFNPTRLIIIGFLAVSDESDLIQQQPEYMKGLFFKYSPLQTCQLPECAITNILSSLVDKTKYTKNEYLKPPYSSSVYTWLSYSSTPNSELPLDYWGFEITNFISRPIDAVISALNQHLDKHPIQSIASLIKVNRKLKTIRIKRPNELAVIFDLKDTCSRVFSVELFSLIYLTNEITKLGVPKKSASILFVTPIKTISCYKDYNIRDNRNKAATFILVQLLNALILTMEKHDHQNTFSMLFFYNETNNQPLPKESFVEDTVELKQLKPIDLSTQRQLQSIESSKPKFPLRPQTVLWLCVVLLFALVFSILPLVSLTSINDPIFASKLLNTGR